jgi:hypothetical protein
MTATARLGVTRGRFIEVLWILACVAATISASGALAQSRSGSTATSKGLEMLLAKDAIREQIYHYSRGLDRMDREMSLNVWHKDGTAEYLLGPDNTFKGTGAEFVEWVFKAHANVTAHSHQMTNIIISVDGDKATSETYGLNSLYNAKTGSTAFTRSRYQDRWSKRNGRWAIDHRQELVDFRTTSVETGAKTVVMGKRDRTDASYAVVPF